MRLQSQLLGMNYQTFSTGLSSGYLGGAGISVMLEGMTSSVEPKNSVAHDLQCHAGNLCCLAAVGPVQYQCNTSKRRA